MSKRKTRSSGVSAPATVTAKSAARKSKRTPLRSIENRAKQDEVPKRDIRKGFTKLNKDKEKEDNDGILESLLSGEISDNSSLEVFIEVKGAKSGGKRKQELIQISKFQKGRNGKLEFVPLNGKPVMFNEKKHNLVQRKRKLGNGDTSKSSKKSKSHVGRESAAISDSEEITTNAQDEKEFSAKKDKEKIPAQARMPQDISGRSTRRKINKRMTHKDDDDCFEDEHYENEIPKDISGRATRRKTNRKVSYKDDENSDEGEHCDDISDDEKNNDAEFTPSKTLQSPAIRGSSTKKTSKSPYKEIIERETSISIGPSWIENDSDWRVFGAIDY